MTGPRVRDRRLRHDIRPDGSTACGRRLVSPEANGTAGDDCRSCFPLQRHPWRTWRPIPGRSSS